MNKYYIILISLIVFTLSAYAQDDIKKVTMDVTVTNYDDVAKSGEQILFESKNNQKTYKGISDKSGKFTIVLPGADTYLIKIKGISMDQDYNEFEIPALQANQEYGIYQLEIKIETPKIFTLDNVFFDTGSAVIRQNSYNELNELFEYLSLKESLIVEIAGHTDNVGDDNSNLNLSQKRAEAVRNWLVRKGIAPDHIIAKGYGETQPVAHNDSYKGKQKNRRTEVRIIKE
jgi:outer membrane protein OmpA-like peptidoglycan-associated protein